MTATNSPDGIPGVNLSLKEPPRGTVTDRTGRYSLTIPDRSDGWDGNAVLVFSFVGYERQKITINATWGGKIALLTATFTKL